MSDEVSAQVSAPFLDRLRIGLKKLLNTASARRVAWGVFAVGVLLFVLRASMAFTPLFETRANTWLDDAFDARLSGLQGAWYAMTPKLRIEQVVLPQGSIQDIVIEIDLLRSLLALAPRIKALQIGSADMTFHEDFDLLESLSGASTGMDLRSVLSDAKRLSGSLKLRIAGHDEVLLVQWVIDAGGQNRGWIRLHPQAGDDPPVQSAEGLVIGFDLDSGVLPGHIEGALWAEGRMHLAEAFASVIGLAGTISALDARVRVTDGQVAARLNVDAQNLQLGDYLLDSVSLFAKAAGTPGDVRGEFQQARLRRGEHGLDFSGSRLSFQGGEALRLQVSDQDIRRLTDFAVASAMRETAVVRWLSRFRPGGHLRDISAQIHMQAPFVLAASLEDFSSESWMGSPALRHVSAKAIYAAGGARLLIDSTNAGLELVKLFEEEVMLAEAKGEVWVRFLPGYVGVQGRDLRARLASGGEVLVNLSYSAPVDPAERQIAGRVEAFHLKPADALQFVPRNLPAGMRAWLDAGVEGGEIEQGEIVLSGYVRRQPPLPTMQVEMWLDWRDGTLNYHPRWPAAQSVSGRVALVGGVVRGKVQRARMLDMRIEDLTFEMPLRGAGVRLSDAGEMPADGLLRLILDSPLGELLPADEAQLEAVGLVEYTFTSHVPFRFNASDFELELGVHLHDVDFSLHAKEDRTRRFTLTEINGPLDYVFPDEVNSDGITGTMFGQALRVGLSSGESAFDEGARMQAEIRSRISAEFLRPYLGELIPIRGETGYAALLEFDAMGEAAPRVRLHSDLQGLSIGLPPGLGKDALDTSPLLVDLEVERGFVAGRALFSLENRVGGELSWQDADTATPEISGALAFGSGHTSMDLLASAGSGISTFGGLPLLTLDDLRSFSAGGGAWQRPDLHFHGFAVGSIDLGDFSLDPVTINGTIGTDAVDVRLQGESLDGTWTSAVDAFGQLSLTRLHLMAAETSEPAGVGGLLGDIDLTTLPEIDVSIDSLKLGDNDYGTWEFGLRKMDSGVRFVNLEADSRGLSIRASEDLLWEALPDGSHTSRFVGELSTDDLADAMVGWGFAPSVSAERALLVADLQWADVPWRPKLPALVGQIDLTIRRGRFREFDAGAGMRLLSLLDFNAFLKRLTLDFSDAFGEGVAFDEVRVKSDFDAGVMRMIEPVKIDGNGGRFRIDGTIDLVSGELDNQFEATLKISRSLPWLAGYMALLGNPVTGLGVVVGERILRDRLEDFSTARYSVTGTLAEPVFALAEVEPPEPLPEEVPEPVEASSGEDLAPEPEPEPEPELESIQQPTEN